MYRVRIFKMLFFKIKFLYVNYFCVVCIIKKKKVYLEICFCILVVLEFFVLVFIN